MDDALARLSLVPFKNRLCRVLILVVMDDALAQAMGRGLEFYVIVLILVVMDDALAHWKNRVKDLPF